MSEQEPSVGGRVARREVLKSLAGTLSAAVLAPACGEPPKGGVRILPDAAADLAEVARAYFGDALTEARAVGAVYIQQLASARDVRADLDRTFAPLAAISAPEAVVERLEQALEIELEQASVTSLAGWQLGPTELRVAAVAELATSGGRTTPRTSF